MEWGPRYQRLHALSSQRLQWALGGIDSSGAYLPGVLVGDNNHFARDSFDHAWKLNDNLKLTPSVFAKYGAPSREKTRRSPAMDVDFNPDSTTSIANADISLRPGFVYGSL